MVTRHRKVLSTFIPLGLCFRDNIIIGYEAELYTFITSMPDILRRRQNSEMSRG